MKTTLGLALVIAIILCLVPTKVQDNDLSEPPLSDRASTTVENLEPLPTLNDDVREFLESKESPLAPHTDFLLEQKHWKLLIAISAIESQYCTRKLGNNCWGIGGDSDYKHYSSIEEAILSADGLITRWQERGRWHTVEDMNCHYVQPCNPNWVDVVNKVLGQMENYERNRRLP